MWNLKAKEDAKAKWQFIVVTPIGMSRVNITDAPAIWVNV